MGKEACIPIGTRKPDVPVYEKITILLACCDTINLFGTTCCRSKTLLAREVHVFCTHVEQSMYGIKSWLAVRGRCQGFSFGQVHFEAGERVGLVTLEVVI